MSNSEQQPPERVWIPRTLAESLSDEQLAQTDIEYVRVQQPASEPEPEWLRKIEQRNNEHRKVWGCPIDGAVDERLITALRKALAQLEAEQDSHKLTLAELTEERLASNALADENDKLTAQHYNEEGKS